MARTDGPHSWGGSAWRFLLAGGVNTLVTGIALTLLSIVIDPRVAYTIVFAAGIALSTYLADRFVYGVPMERGTRLTYAAMYLVVFVIGLVALDLARRAGLPDAASGLVVVVTAPLTFLGGRLITTRLHRSRVAAAALPTEER